MAQTPRKELGQHWLFDQYYLQAVIDAAQLQPNDTVFEIGPGLGTLTEHLVEKVKKIIAVELDPHLASQLAAQGPTLSKLEVVQGDILGFDLTALPKDYKVVANIPYYLTGKLLRLLTDSTNPPRTMTLLVQKEVAERLAAQSGQLSVLGVVVQLFGEVRLGQVVPASAFTPPPNVDSQIVHVSRHAQPLFPKLDRGSFLKVVKAGFGEKRKKLRSALAGGLQLEKSAVDELLQRAKIPPQARAQELSLEEWHRLWQTWHS